MPDQEAQPSAMPQSKREISSSISSAMVRLLHEYTGRGATTAQTTITGDLVVILLEDSLTKGERSLAEAGERTSVLNTRRTYQELMREDASAAVAELTGRSVIAFFSDNHAEPDLAVEVFVLAPLSQDGVRTASEAGETPVVSASTEISAPVVVAETA